MEVEGAADLGRGASLPPDQAPYLHHTKTGGECGWPGPWGWPSSCSGRYPKICQAAPHLHRLQIWRGRVRLAWAAGPVHWCLLLRLRKHGVCEPSDMHAHHAYHA
eukprot:1160787-Pelagomonas_calceolata.AAC.8